VLCEKCYRKEKFKTHDPVTLEREKYLKLLKKYEKQMKQIKEE